MNASTEPPTRSSHPHDRLTGLANEMIEHLRQRDDVEDVKAIVFLYEGDNGGVGISGYDDDTGMSAVTDVLFHLAAVFRSNGKTLQLMDENGVFLLGGDH